MNKKQRKEIIERWRNTQFMNGVKEGSALEWRLAYSFNYMAIAVMEYMSYEECTPERLAEIEACSVFSFPIVRQCLTTKNRLSRTILPEEIIWPLLNLSWKDLYAAIKETNPKLKQKTFRQKKIDEFLSINNTCDKRVIELLIGNILSGNKAVITTDIFERLTDIDFVATVLVMVSDYVKMKGKDFINGALDYEKDLPFKPNAIDGGRDPELAI